MCISSSSPPDLPKRLVRWDFVSCESGAVEVDQAGSVPNSCPIVTSFGFEIGLSGATVRPEWTLAPDVENHQPKRQVGTLALPVDKSLVGSRSLGSSFAPSMRGRHSGLGDHDVNAVT